MATPDDSIVACPDLLPQKRCSSCKQSKPIILFSHNRSRPDGLHSECKACNSQQLLAASTARPEYYRRISRERAARWRATNPEKYQAAKMRAYSRRDAGRVRRSSRAYRTTHRDVIHAQLKRRHALRKGAPINDFTAAQWRAMCALYGSRCVYCGRKMARLTQDHITPLSKGGAHTASNIVPACLSCNCKKRAGAVLCPIQPALLLAV